MATFVVCLRPESFVLWSDTTDAPTSSVLTEQQMVDRLCQDDEMTVEAARYLVSVALSHGTSDPDRTLADVIASNRAGADESLLTVEQILDAYA